MAIAVKKKSVRSESVQARIAYYAALSTAEVDRELEEAGIDPTPTIEAIEKLMRKKFRRVSAESQSA